MCSIANGHLDALQTWRASLPSFEMQVRWHGRTEKGGEESTRMAPCMRVCGGCWTAAVTGSQDVCRYTSIRQSARLPSKALCCTA